MGKKLEPEEIGFRRGVAWAVWVVAHFHREETIAEELISESGITLSQFISAGVEDPDLPVIRKLSREINRKAA